MKRIILSAATIAIMSGCASTSTTTDADNASKANAANKASASGVQQNGVPAYRDPNSLLSQKRSFYFDTDEYVIHNDDKKTVELHAAYLSKHPEQKITIEGNTDEQGSREYNLALGQKRALAVKQAMTIYGVKDGQIETTSYGKERPVATGHTEADWAKNRRADIKYDGDK